MSEITIEEIKNQIRYFCPIEIYINDELIWTDDIDLTNYSEEAANELIKQNNNEYFAIFERKDKVKEILVKIVHFHHSIVYIRTK